MLQSIFQREISPIPIIADPEKIWYNNYGIEKSFLKSTFSRLTTFIQTSLKAKFNQIPMHLMAENES